MSIFFPSRYITRVEHIDLDALWASGKRAILLDRDNTLVPRDRTCAPDSVAAWLDHARELGFELIMVSNNWHVESRPALCAASSAMDYISFACKPLPFAITAGMKRLGARKEEAVMVGDQLYTDVWGGKLAGVTTILVKPQSTADLWYTQIFRIFERMALSGVPCEE
ncbi:MAG: YqeG family HAD IIIA-type phosphatase [Collinsella sp.]